MAISDRLNKLTTDITSAYTSIENKGGTIPANKNTNNLPTAIDSIEVIEQATAEGESLSLSNTKAMPYSDYVVKGKSEQATSILPEGYTQVEYIESTGTQYIDTNYTPVQGDDLEFKNVTAESFNNIGEAIFSAGTGDFQLILLGVSNVLYYKYFQSGDALGISFSNITNGNIRITNGNLYIDNILKLEANYGGTVNTSLNIFRRANNTSYFIGKIGEIIISNNGIIKRDFIPCYRNSDNEIGLYDTVNDVFYTNQGTGTFLKGNDVSIPNPNYPSEIHSVADDVNLFDKEATISSTGYITSYTYSNGIYTIIPTGTGNPQIRLNVSIPQGTYTLNSNNYLSIATILRNNNGLLYSFENNYENQTFTINESSSELVFNWVNPNNTNPIILDFNTLKIQKGTVATPYSPYNQGTVTIKQRGTTESNDYIIQTSPLRSLPNGVKDTIEIDGIHRRVGRIVLDGTQSLEITNWRPTETSVGWVYPRSITNNKKQTEGVINNILCNKLKAVSYASLFENTVDEGINIVTQSNAYGLVIKIKDTSLTTDNAINTYLSSNPITVQYELETEIIEPLTQNQATTMLDIIKTGSYEGTTNIYTDEDVKPTIGVDYYKKG